MRISSPEASFYGTQKYDGRFVSFVWNYIWKFWSVCHMNFEWNTYENHGHFDISHIITCEVHMNRKFLLHMYFKWSSCELHMKFICNYVWNIEVAMIFICISFEVHMTHRPELSNEISYEWYEPSVVQKLSHCICPKSTQVTEYTANLHSNHRHAIGYVLKSAWSLKQQLHPHLRLRCTCNYSSMPDIQRWFLA